MRSRIIILLACSFAFLYLFNSCKHKPFPAPTYGNFPDEVGIIFTTKCAVTGCHDAAGSINADNLRLDSWEALFKGSSHGSVVIPYNTDYSSLLSYINTDSTRGQTAIPTMPYLRPALTSEEYYTIKNWIAAGSPNKNGNIPFGSNPDTRQKIYMVLQGCDLMAVIDGESKLIMRMFPIGGDVNQTEAPHNVHVSPDGKYAYVAFSNGPLVQQIDTRIDTVVRTISLGDGRGGVVCVNPDSPKVMVGDLTFSELWKADFDNLQATRIGQGAFPSAHGIVSVPTWDTFFITAQYGNVVFRYTPGKLPPIANIRVDTNAPVSYTGQLYGDPHDIIMSPDNSKFFVTCQHTGEVRVLDAHTQQVLAVWSFGANSYPQEMAISTSKQQIFVTCMEDATNPNPGALGSVRVYDYSTLQPVTTIYGSFYEPHGVCVDERDKVLYIISANIGANGPPPHHVTKCGNKIGWYSIYDLNTLQPINNYRYEATVAPYYADARFK